MQDIGETYCQSGARGASGLDLVVMLYDVLLDDLRRSIAAIDAHDIESRTNELQHAMRVLEQLQGALDMERGGEPARGLDRLYSLVRGKLLEAQWKASREVLQQQIGLLTPIRDAWKQVRDQESPLPPPPPPAATEAHSEWRI
jgi:flagellar protein FliS